MTSPGVFRASARPRDQRAARAGRAWRRRALVRVRRGGGFAFSVIKEKLFRLLATLVKHPSGITMKVRSQISQSNLATLFKVVLNFLCTLRTQNKGSYIWSARGPLSWRFGVSFKPPDLEGKLIWKVS